MPKLAKIRGLYPVEFNRRLTLFEEGRFGSTTPWPIDFTREGLEAEFLWLGDTAAGSQQVWSEFPGRVRLLRRPRGQARRHRLRPLFRSRSRRRRTSSRSTWPGSSTARGRVFYLGSGEMWRLRALDDRYFEQFYTKLIRHVSQGRLLLGSSRGMLLVDRDRYLLGNTVVVRAQLSDAQFEPLERRRASRSRSCGPTARAKRLQLMPDPTPQGHVRRAVHRAGGRHVSPGAAGARRRCRGAVAAHPGARAGRRTREPRAQRRAVGEIAKRTGGMYYVGADAVLGSRGLPPLASNCRTARKPRIWPASPDRDFERELDARSAGRHLPALVPGVADPPTVETGVRTHDRAARKPETQTIYGNRSPTILHSWNRRSSPAGSVAAPHPARTCGSRRGCGARVAGCRLLDQPGVRLAVRAAAVAARGAADCAGRAGLLYVVHRLLVSRLVVRLRIATWRFCWSEVSAIPRQPADGRRVGGTTPSTLPNSIPTCWPSAHRDALGERGRR